MSTASNVVSVARREATVRVRTRAFIFGTLLLVVGAVAIALVPVFVQYIEGASSDQVTVYVGADGLRSDPATTLRALLNAKPTNGSADESGTDTQAFDVTTATDLESARADVTAGRSTAVLDIERGSDGELSFTLYTNQPSAGRTVQLIQQAANAVAVADRLDRLGVEAADQASLFRPATYAVAWPDPTRTDETPDATTLGSTYLLGFGMTVLIFMMIVLYGNWVAMSVVEEKSSRVMEVILNAATPFQLLGGKVLGVGTAAFLQYAAILVAAGLALVLQGQIATLLLGEGGGAGLPEGLSLPLLLVFCVYGVLGFLLYAVLYAAAGSLVSRQEDVNTAVMPMTMITVVGYMIAVYASTGSLDVRSEWLTVLSVVPFLSPFLMLPLVVNGQATAPQVVVSIALLLATIAVAWWFAARIYSVGVLLYGQRPDIRSVWRMVRAGV
jgi:ABC-2 type transport system permease protein